MSQVSSTGMVKALSFEHIAGVQATSAMKEAMKSMGRQSRKLKSAKVDSDETEAGA